MNISLIPHNNEAEISILGAIILDGLNILTLVRQHIPNNEHIFYDEKHELIYTSMCNLQDQNIEIDLITLTDMLRTQNNLQKIGGPEYLAELSLTATSANIQFHIDLVLEASKKRCLINISSLLRSLSFDGSYSASDIKDQVETELRHITSLHTSTFANMRELLHITLNKIEEYRQNPGLTGLSTGFYDLDRLINGLQPSLLYILAARTSMGKSAFSLQVGEFIANSHNNKAVVVFSLEMSKEQLIYRLLSSSSRVNSSNIRQGNIVSSEYERLLESANSLSYLPLFINDSVNLSPADIKNKCLQVLQRMPIQLIIIDYLQLLRLKKSSENRQQEITQIVQDLKSLAKELNVPILVMCQLNRSIEHRSPPIPQLSDLRESGSIEMTGDVILALYRDEVYNLNTEEAGIARLIILKQRDGPLGTIQLAFLPTYARFESLQRNQ